MQRVVDVRTALEGRGWAAHVARRLEVEVADPALGTTERFTVDFAGGRALVNPGGSGRVRCPVEHSRRGTREHCVPRMQPGCN